MERKLAQYRAKKSMETYLIDLKSKISKIGDSFTDKSNDFEENDVENEKLIDNIEPKLEDDLDCSIPEVTEEGYSKLTYFLILTVWLCFYYLFIRLEFGLVYLVLSCIVGICLNTRTGSKKKGEVSAYSVFNENCEAIDGSINMEQFEKELGYRVR